MSFVVDQVRRIDAQLDKLQLAGLPSAEDASVAAASTGPEAREAAASPRVANLQSVIKSLSTTSSARSPLLSAWRIQYLLEQAELSASASASTSAPSTSASASADLEAADSVRQYEDELEWLLVAKATAQVYGLVLTSILDSTIPLADDLWYWDDVLGSRRRTALYSVQTSPLRLYAWTRAVWSGVRARLRDFRLADLGAEGRRTTSEGLAQQWGRFYGLVADVVRERNVSEMRRRVVDPIARVRSEVRAKQARLRRARQMGANALGVLLGEGLVNER
ncbi:Nuclear control of ATPase protein 2 [Elasticomyces elasticus]|nr:Nuclear control of ATPase protein 2 [Elasticomyces elasticus]